MDLDHGPEINSPGHSKESVIEHVKAVLEDLANEIEYQLTPFAFRCSCKGTDKSCRQAMDDPGLYAQYLTAARAAAIIRKAAQ